MRSLTAVEGYKMADHKQNGDTEEQLGMTGINTATGTAEKKRIVICEERLSPKLLYQYRPKGNHAGR